MGGRQISAREREWLNQELGFWRSAGLIAPDQLQRIQDCYETLGDGKARKRSLARFARSWNGNDLRFGIEAFYVQEGTGKELERLRNSGQLSAEIAVTPWGQARLCGLE